MGVYSVYASFGAFYLLIHFALRASLRTPADAVAAVRTLVANEAEGLALRQAVGAAADAVGAPLSGGGGGAQGRGALSGADDDGGDGVMAGVLRHCMGLLGCSRLEGVVPAMNKVGCKKVWGVDQNI